MSSRYPIPAATARVALTVVNSRFIATAGPTPSVEAAKALVAEVRAEMPDATHHCYAYLVGYGASVTAGMSDDGEPAGTAGRPMLAVLRGADLGDVAVVVTRYFGGTLLGTGGLVRAYGDAVKAVLEALPRGERVELRPLVAAVSYGAYAAARRALEGEGATIVDEQFGAEVRLSAQVPADALERAATALAEATAGQARVESE
ncbi:MAG TPA: YigZ family protein [Chloroflexaceae bacterium]|nr:YigZ family protein [Chloroflexaceae bacterium]